MAHYAFLDKNNIVTEVIVGIDENELIDGKIPENFYAEVRQQKCVRTSYNRNIRKNYAGLGYIYNEEIDAFVPPKCHQEAIINNDALWDCSNEEHLIALDLNHDQSVVE